MSDFNDHLISGTPENDAERECAAVKTSPLHSGSPRFVVVSDLPEWTVCDQEQQCDLFPTKSGNRDYACRRCGEDTAHLIADALNAYTTPPFGSAATVAASERRENGWRRVGGKDCCDRCVKDAKHVLLHSLKPDEAALPPVWSEPLLSFDKCVCFRCEAERPAEKCPGDCSEAPGTKQDYDCAHCPKHEHCEGWLYDNVDHSDEES